MRNAFALKLLLCALMVLDHLYYFLPGLGFPLWFTGLGRMVAPGFCFLMTQSLVHTRSRGRLIGRMAAAGLVMWAGSRALTAYVASLTGRAPAISNTIFLSLAASAALVDAAEHLREGPSLRYGAQFIAAFVLCPLVEGAYLLPVMAMVFYFLRDRKALMCVAYVAVSTAYLLLFSGLASPSPRYNLTLGGLAFQVQYLQVLALIPILLYNGEPGPKNAFTKWFFYLFYPLHIWALYLLGVFL